MNLKDFPVGSNTDFAPMDAGTYNAVCIGLVDIGTQTLDYAGETSQRGQMIILFEFPEETIDIDGNTMPRNLSLKCSKSNNAKSTLRKTLTAWRGKDFTPEELGDFHLSRLLGVPATVAVAHREHAGKTYAFVASVTKPMKSNKFTASRKVYFDLHAPETFHDVDKLPKWIIDTINKSQEAIEGGIAFKQSKQQTDDVIGEDNTTF